MKRSILTMFAIALALQTPSAQAYSQRHDENCLKQEIIQTKVQGCQVLTEVVAQVRSFKVGIAYEYFCSESRFQIDPHNSAKIVSKMSDEAIVGLSEIENSLPIGQKRLKISDWIGDLIDIRTNMSIAELRCSMEALPLPFDKAP